MNKDKQVLMDRIGVFVEMYPQHTGKEIADLFDLESGTRAGLVASACRMMGYPLPLKPAGGARKGQRKPKAEKPAKPAKRKTAKRSDSWSRNDDLLLIECVAGQAMTYDEAAEALGRTGCACRFQYAELRKKGRRFEGKKLPTGREISRRRRAAGLDPAMRHPAEDDKQAEAVREAVRSGANRGGGFGVSSGAGLAGYVKGDKASDDDIIVLKNRRDWTKGDIRKLHAMWHNGGPVEDMAAEFGLNQSDVYVAINRMRKAGIESKKRYRTGKKAALADLAAELGAK